MYRHFVDGPQFRPVPAAPPPPRVVGGPFMASLSPSPQQLHPPGPPQGRPSSAIQQPLILQQYAYPLPQPPLPPPPPLPSALQTPAPAFVPQFGSLRPPLPPMHPPAPSMHASPLPPLQHPLSASNMPPSLPPPPPLLYQPLPPPMQAGFQSLQSSLPPGRPVSVPFQAPLMQVQPSMPFPPMPLPSMQSAPFMPPLPPSPPMENPPPPPPASPPPQSPPPPHADNSRSRVELLLSPEPPKPNDPEMLKNIDVLAALVVRNGPRFESMARARQAGDPKFAFLFESDAAPEAAIGHEFYKWEKKRISLELGLETGNKRNSKASAGPVVGSSQVTVTSSSLFCDMPDSPAVSDMDMEDDFTPSPIKNPAQPCEFSYPRHEFRESPSMNGDMVHKEATQSKLTNLEALPSTSKVNEEIHLSRLPNPEEPNQRVVRKFSNSHNKVDPILDNNSNSSMVQDDVASQSSFKGSELLQCRALGCQEHCAGRSSRWEALPLPGSGSDPAKYDRENIARQNMKKSSSPIHENLIDANQVGTNGNEIGKVDFGSLGPETTTVDEFGRLVEKEFVEREGEDEGRPRKRRRSRTRSKSRSRSRVRRQSKGRSRSGSRSRNRGWSRSTSRSRSYSPGESRWKRQDGSRSPSRRRRWSRSRSRSPIWHQNDTWSPPRDRWGGGERGDRDWRIDRESYGRGRRGGRGTGTPVCFHYARGRCFRGTACKFLHPEREIGPERGLQLGDVQAVGFKHVEPMTSRLLVESDSVVPLPNHGIKDGHTDLEIVSTGEGTDISQEAGLNKEEKMHFEQPTSERESLHKICDFASEKPKQDERTPDECLEAVGTVEPGNDEKDLEQSGLVKNVDNIQEGLEVEESTKNDNDASSKVVEESTKVAAKQNTDARKSMMSPTRQSELSPDIMVEKGSTKLSSASGLEEVSACGPAEAAVEKPGVDQRSSLSAVLPSQVKVMTNSLHNTNSFSKADPLPEEPVLASKPLDSTHISSPAGSQAPSTSLSNRNSFPLSSPSKSQQIPISNPSSYGAAFQPHHRVGDTVDQEPILLPQDRLPPRFELHQPAKLASNQSVLQQLDNQSHLRQEPWDLDSTFPISKKESTYPRSLDGNLPQYGQSTKVDDVLQHTYPMSNILPSSAASIHLPRNQNTLVAPSVPGLSSRAEKYSYTLTTIPPLPNHIKLRGGLNVHKPSAQYDPLSDGLEPGPAVNASSATAVDAATINEAGADIGVVENVSPPGEWSPVQPGDAANVAHDHSKIKKSNRGLKLLRTAVADRVKALLKPAWKEGRLSKDAFKTIAKKAVEKVTGNLPSHHIPKSQEKVDQFMAVSRLKISKLVQGYIEKYSKV